MSSVAELFGNPVTAALSGWRNIVADQHCPYTNSRCYKVRKSAPDVSIGTCAVNYGRHDDLLVICPARMLDRRQIFVDCLQLLMSHEPGNELRGEVPVPGGSVDYFLVSARDGKAKDFIGIELQTLDTTGAIWPERQRTLRALDVPRNDDEENNTKPFGMNWKMTAKTILMQLHHKIQTFENVNRKLVLVVQDKLLDYMEREFDFSHLTEPAMSSDAMHIHAYQANRIEQGFRLGLSRRISTDTDGIRACLGLQADANLELTDIMRTLESRMTDATVFAPI